MWTWSLCNLKLLSSCNYQHVKIVYQYRIELQKLHHNNVSAVRIPLHLSHLFYSQNHLIRDRFLPFIISELSAKPSLQKHCIQYPWVGCANLVRIPGLFEGPVHSDWQVHYNSLYLLRQDVKENGGSSATGHCHSYNKW